ncbi:MULTISPECIES: Crp/Fnr family transcriptional regulator [unclassified Streptomyces]|uniref:Crp/Fnr family transcriptional regulator n=1 Tax=unclassified Streptomyces TaxID=2593676 RepID=UPI000DDADF2C|nr:MULTISPECIES: Crp/Fnr family transcriptional regulator [unclassified Streptomyces]QZZ26380.1 Crp/Fnr family transcriptional regulator [Streptomyces sp. ST1015]
MTYGSNPNSRTGFLDTLSPEARAAFTRLGTRRRYAAGDVLMHEGDREHELVVLHEGLVKVSVRLDDRAQLVDIKAAGDVVGEVAALDGGPRSATVTCGGDVVGTVIPQHELKAFLLAHPETSLPLTRVLCGRLRRSDRLRVELGGFSLQVRLARVLVELAESYGRPADTLRGPNWNKVRIEVALSQSEFAALTASTTDSVHKALARLRQRKIITTGSRQTSVEDMARLRKAARL